MYFDTIIFMYESDTTKGSEEMCTFFQPLFFYHYVYLFANWLSEFVTFCHYNVMLREKEYKRTVPLMISIVVKVKIVIFKHTLTSVK